MIYEFIAVTTFLASCLSGYSAGSMSGIEEFKENVDHLRTFFLPGFQNPPLSHILGKIKQDFIYFLKEDLLGREYIVTALKGSKSNHSLIFVNPSEQPITIDIKFPDHDCYTRIQCLNDTKIFTLQPNQTEVVQFKCDVAGTSVNASREIALYYVSSTRNITLAEQILPLKLWGQYYVVLPSGNPDDRQIILIQTAHNNTDVHILGYDYVTIPNRFLSIQRRIMGTLPVTIKSSKPVSVSQVLFSVNEIDSVMVNIVPVKYSIEKTTLQNSSVFEYEYLKNTGLKGNLKVPLSQYTYNNGSYDTLPDIVYGCTMMYTRESEPSYPITNCGYWNDSKTDNPWPLMTPGDGVDNNGNDNVDEEDCFSDFMNNKSPTINKTDCKVSSGIPVTLFVIPTPDKTNLLLHCPIMNDKETSFSYGNAIHWMDTTGNVKIEQGTLILLKIKSSTKINMINCHYKSNNEQISNDFWIPSVDNLQTQYVAVLNFPIIPSATIKTGAGCVVGSVFDKTNFTYDENIIIPLGNSFTKQEIFQQYLNENQIFIIASHIISVHCYVQYKEYYFINHLIPVSENSFHIDKSFKNSSEEQLTVISTDSNTLLQVSSWNQSEFNCSKNEYYLLIEKGGDIRRFPMEEKFDILHIESNKPVIVMIFYKKDNNGSLILSEYKEYNLDYITPTYLQSTDVRFDPSYTLTPGSLRKRRYNSTSNQIPGDKIDNDQDGLIDEEYCGFLLGDNELFDIDLDGSLNEDCKGCPEGQELEPVMICRNCNIGTYRENSSSIDKCQACGENMTTFYNRSVSPTDCIPICEEGMELDNETKTCRPCPVGYYKEISANDTKKPVIERFWCEKCPENNTTFTSGTVSGDQCIAICEEGMELDNETKTCRHCPVGYYKEISANDTKKPVTERFWCEKCPENNTTYTSGTVSGDQCIAICVEGMELDNETKTCRPCPVGYYKEISANDTKKPVTERFWCKKCPENNTTYTSGTISGNQCIDHCGVGMYLEKNVCHECDIGFFKNTSSEKSELREELRWNCSQCPDGQTTNSTGAEKCVENCLKGNEYNSTTRKCHPCNYGFFKNISGNHIDCYQCPENHTTVVLGATDISQCKRAGCRCPCNMVHTPKNFTDEELTKAIEEIKKKLAVNKEKLSSNIRKKISVMDNRPSARGVGFVGVIILTVCFGLLIALDYVTLTRHILGLLRGIRDFFLRS